MEQPVKFKNRNGCMLFGMLYLPEPEADRRLGVVISVNAIKYRLGTFRMHALLARQLCARGYTVFSFDPQGIGDSEGEFEYKLLSEHYYDIQVGKYTNDLRDAIGYLSGARALDSVLVLGLCGGAISVLLEAAADARVGGLILLNLPVLVEDLARKGAPDTAGAITSTQTARSLLKGKMHRLIEPKFWGRVVSLKVDFREEGKLVTKAIQVMVTRTLSKLRPQEAAAAGPLTEPVSRNRLYNMHFQRAFASVMGARKPTLFVFAEHDAWTWIFKSEFQDPVLKPGNRYEPYCQVRVIQGSNHIFSSRTSQSELFRTLIEWLESRWPGAAGRARVASAS